MSARGGVRKAAANSASTMILQCDHEISFLLLPSRERASPWMGRPIRRSTSVRSIIAYKRSCLRNFADKGNAGVLKGENRELEHAMGFASRDDVIAWMVLL